jgi:hypothetical protein
LRCAVYRDAFLMPVSAHFASGELAVAGINLVFNMRR